MPAPVKERTEPVTVSMPTSMKEKLDNLCAQTGFKRSTVMCMIMGPALDNPRSFLPSIMTDSAS